MGCGCDKHTFNGQHEIIQRIVVQLVRFGIVSFLIFIDRSLHDIDGSLSYLLVEGNLSLGRLTSRLLDDIGEVNREMRGRR